MKIRKIILVMLGIFTVVASIFGCGKKDARIDKDGAVDVEVQFPIESVGKVQNDKEPLTDTDRGYFIYDEAWNIDGTKPEIVPVNEFVMLNGDYSLIKDLFIFNKDGKIIGYAKEGETLSITDGNEEWLRIYNTGIVDGLNDESFFVKVAALEDATAPDIIVVRKEENKEIIDSELIVSAKTQEVEEQDVKPGIKKPVEEKIKVESSPVVETVAENALPIEEPVTVENTKYTPEEAVAVYRSIMEANGITWNPSLKNGGSWGTGWIYLDKGMPEWTASTNIESAKMGNGDGTSWDNYYLEITGSDENVVYITEWAD